MSKTLECRGGGYICLMLRFLTHLEWDLCKVRDKDLLLLFCKLISSFPSTIEDSVFSLMCFFSIYLWHLSCFLGVIYLDPQFFLLDLNACVCQYRDSFITMTL